MVWGTNSGRNKENKRMERHRNKDTLTVSCTGNVYQVFQNNRRDIGEKDWDA